MTDYIALLRKDPDSDFGVEFPDFPGCISAGQTLDEARAMASEALAGHVEILLEDGETLPRPSTLEEVMQDPENREAVAFLVSVQDAPSKVVRVNITMNSATLARIDQAAHGAGLSRSAFLVQSALRAAVQV